jgi:hypothetical protein
MSKITDRADADTLEIIGRHPGSKRTDTFIVKAAVTRLINSGLVIPPTTNGRLYLTEAGTVAVWAEVIDGLDAARPNGSAPCRRPAEADPFRPADHATACPDCGSELAWNDEDGLAGQACPGCGREFSGTEAVRAPAAYAHPADPSRDDEAAGSHQYAARDQHDAGNPHDYAACGYAHPASAGNGWTSDAPQGCGLDGCDCHRPATVVLDGRFGRGVTHQCSGTWSPPLGQNAGGHDVHQCDGTTTHRYIGAHRVAGHQCGTECASATVTS